MGATITSSGTWTTLATDLTALRATAGSRYVTGQLPALDPADWQTLPSELHSFIFQAAKGFAAAQFDQAAPSATGSQLHFLATLLLVRALLDAYIQRGFPGHDATATRGVGTTSSGPPVA
jgi:hypothetical protein